MADAAVREGASPVGITSMPTRLHHHAYTTFDMEKTRQFYEDIIGMPLTQTWIESRSDPSGQVDYCHCFFGLADGGALAFFEYAGQEPITYATPQLSFHIALRCDDETQRGIHERLLANGYRDDQVRLTDHGYCVSLYVNDPNGLMLEFTVDHPEIDRIVAEQAANAHRDLARWQGGDHSVNNTFRPRDH
ncbi:MAG: VOC family protein [Acidimicrobiales bacterium]|nr:VOC family protein [Acidimicrobiales bacterium]